MTQETFDALARRFQVLSDAMRLKILHALRAGELTVTDLVSRAGSSQPNISKHLATLLANGLVQRRREGTSVFYSITDPTIFELCDEVCGGIERDLARRRRAMR